MLAHDAKEITSPAGLFHRLGPRYDGGSLDLLRARGCKWSACRVMLPGSALVQCDSAYKADGSL